MVAQSWQTAGAWDARVRARRRDEPAASFGRRPLRTIGPPSACGLLIRRMVPNDSATPMPAPRRFVVRLALAPGLGMLPSEGRAPVRHFATGQGNWRRCVPSPQSHLTLCTTARLAATLALRTSRRALAPLFTDVALTFGLMGVPVTLLIRHQRRSLPPSRWFPYTEWS